MNEIIRGTTPTITVTFPTVDVSTITAAFLTIKSGRPPHIDKEAVVTKPLADATVGDNTISWTLTQTDTLALTAEEYVTVLCDWKVTDGTRGRSQAAVFSVSEAGVNEVI